MLIALLLIQAASTAAPAPPIRPILDQKCTYDRDRTDITVCGRRNADRFRVPILVHEPGDPRHETVPAERERLLARSNPVKDLSPFLVGGGMTGVTVSSTGAVTGATYRPLAP
ncbi:hypothetical protein D9601_00870 [Sphingomonas sp. MA1305]|uniref:hypothetical protein n=1 Tax=Sphingomonas sp. MA1305 TaxID=2479204 RepID=UPI0018DF5E44|nr:hypothetical protein [Sphingomonas sp. MA1305]MBI0473915.1 hypothetical protein [Sphingomonas sp. MA1305]